MKVRAPFALLIAAAAMMMSFGAAGSAAANDAYSAASYTNRIEALETELASMRSTMDHGGGYVGCDSCGGANVGCDTCGGAGYGYGGDCCGEPGFVGKAELLFLRYHRADGVRVGADANEDAEFDFETAPRITVGYGDGCGRGIRLRWFEYDHFADADEDDSGIGVDTYNIDLELYNTLRWCETYEVELSAGIRYNHFDEELVDAGEGDRINSFDGFGGIVGAEFRWGTGLAPQGANSFLFARTRGAILMDDKDVINDEVGIDQDVELRDSTQGMFELALGYEANAATPYGDLFGQVGVEWQNWYNYSSEFDQLDTEAFDGSSDVGFGGLFIAAGLRR